MSYNRGKVKKGKSNVNVIKTPFGDMPFYINPNKDKGIKAPKTLNKLASICEEEVYATDRENIKAGFELNPADFKWEYHVDYFDSRLVLKEYEDGEIYMWMYLGNKDKFTADYEGYLPKDMNVLVMQVVEFCKAAFMNNSGKKVEFQQAEVA